MPVYQAVYYTPYGEAILADCGHKHGTPKLAMRCLRETDGTYNAIAKRDGKYWIITPVEEAP